jgi:hypothetical protein
VHNVQERLVVVTGVFLADDGGRIVALLFAQLLECFQLLLLVVVQMAIVCRGVLERLDARQVGHDGHEVVEDRGCASGRRGRIRRKKGEGRAGRKPQVEGVML